jgi:hypothetical protein
MKSNNIQNQEALDSPQAGDYWHEMFCPYFIVLKVIGDKLIICDTRKDIDKNHWTWSLKDWKKVDRSYLKKKVTYKTIDGFCADVVRSSKNYSFVEDFNELTKNVEFSYVIPLVEKKFTQIMDMGI